MMKSLMFSLAVFSMPAMAGNMIVSNMYSENSFVQGVGRTMAEAEADALSALPQPTSTYEWVLDSQNSATVQCLMGAFSEADTCEGQDNYVIFTKPVVMVVKKP